MSDMLPSRAAPPAEATVPGPHLGLTWRTLTPADLDDLHALVQRCEEVDQPLSRTRRTQLEEMLARPATGMKADSLGGFDAAGTLRAAAFVHAPRGDETHARVFIGASVDPSWRGRGIGRALLTWQDDRARQILATLDPALPGRIASYVDEHLHDRRRLYAAAGFSALRTYREMRRRLTTEPAAVPVPEGYEVRQWTPELDDAVRRAHNEAFRDHWGSQPVDEGTWAARRTDLEPAWSVVAIHEETGEVAGYALTARHEHEWERLGHSEGYTELLGVLRPHRGVGLARAMLSSVLAALYRDGIEVAALDVDMENPSGAYHFYERMGYEPQAARILYTIEV
ncbi:GNAT family N-acetyltransferase [uncultured Georgenia sp.]|uniref:GNAT family N-acetyltransferase n=1 Tax=uncultured Georgenia sp. TaxID=378209 RepID=UPI002614A5F4|nr:GNAT family N-acetyltransferase [uncultured Georgenia sp.]HLV05925.1 GNAT family N-acetyltransferase [Actinomycetaceae bacterium]